MGSHIVRDVDERGRERTTIFCSRDRRPKTCYACGNPSVKLCDFKVDGGTCDRPLCIDHFKHVTYQTDFCPEHVFASASSGDTSVANP
jgi:hypothetical protein